MKCRFLDHARFKATQHPQATIHKPTSSITSHDPQANILDPRSTSQHPRPNILDPQATISIIDKSFGQPASQRLI